MTPWDYTHVEVPDDGAGTWRSVLDKFGREGWELVDRDLDPSGCVSMVFKRPADTVAGARHSERPEPIASRTTVRTNGLANAATPTVPDRLGRDARGRRYAALVWEILTSIADGSLNTGDRLPNERQLAELTNAARSTVRDALLVLELLGVVEVRPGSGAYVTEHAGHTGILGSVHFDASPRVLIEARTQIEPAIAALCASRTSRADIDRLSRLVDESEQEARRTPADAPESFLQLSLQFHSDLAAVCGNEVLAKTTQQLVDATSHPLWMVVNGMYVRTAASRAAQIADHRAVLQAIAQHQPEAAAAAMDEHLCRLSFGVFAQHGPSGPITAQRWRGRSII